MSRRRWAHLALGLLGLLGIAWAVVFGAHPQITCHDAVLQPGGVCVNANTGKTHTYEEQVAAAQAARPVVGTLGLLVVAFASYLWVADSTSDETDGG
ncbi:MAG: hypothetical protein IPO80_02175 [Propionibacteriaceae bacterium]|nr:hypothetical protein [Propionibacteriaceae bacterium]